MPRRQTSGGAEVRHDMYLLKQASETLKRISASSMTNLTFVAVLIGPQPRLGTLFLFVLLQITRHPAIATS